MKDKDEKGKKKAQTERENFGKYKKEKRKKIRI